MVAPVYGPYDTTSGDKVNSYVRKIGYRQKRPFDTPAPYDMRQAIVHTRQGGQSNYNAQDLAETAHLGAYAADWDPLYSRAYERFKSKVSDRASMGVSLLEFTQSYGMITSRATQLYQFARHVSRGRFRDASKALKVSIIPKGVSRKKAAADNFLEYAFGWAPLISDIGNSVDVLQQPIKNVWASGKIKEPFARYNMSVPYSGSDPNAVYPNLLAWESYDYVEGIRRIAIGAQIRIDNPNLWLANQMGFVNPAVFIYEKIPFSFLANWVFNVDQFIAASTDWYGLALEKAWTTYFCNLNRKAINFATYRWQENGEWVYGGGLFRKEGATITQIRRSLGIASPSLFLRPLYVPGLMRAFTAVSLLTQQLSSMRR